MLRNIKSKKTRIRDNHEAATVESVREKLLASLRTPEEIERRRKMREGHATLERFVARLPKLPSSVPVIREDRKKH